MMNHDYFQNPMFREPVTIPSQSTQPPITNMPQTIPSYGVQNIPNPMPYAENLLEKNIGKLATFYMSYSDSLEWRDKIFTGVLEAAGRDYALLRDPSTGKWTILWTVYLNYVVFDEPLKID